MPCRKQRPFPAWWWSKNVIVLLAGWAMQRFLITTSLMSDVTGSGRSNRVTGATTTRRQHEHSMLVGTEGDER